MMERETASDSPEEGLQEILKGCPERDATAIRLLQKAQEELGYVSKDAVLAISDFLGLSESEVYGIATFYAEFKTQKPARHNIKVCEGTSCYLSKGKELLEHISRHLDVRAGRTTADGMFYLETVACLGCCSRSPVMSVDGVIYGDVSASQADDILAGLK
jgi:NADH-quinone oxidoreductase subunit E